jgi:GPH family glycoside/pentoside/hexuronide:cation symporter
MPPLSNNIGWTVMGTVMGGIMLTTAMITFITVREPDKAKITKKTGIIRSYLSVLKQKVFLLVLFPWTLHITGVTVVQGALLYYFKYIYRKEDFFPIALFVLLLSSMIFIPIWVRISKCIGKKASYNTGMVIFAFAVLIFFFFGQNLGVYFALVIMAVAGIGFATQYVMPYSIIPDVVEYDYSEKGVRREGVFYGLWTFTSKVGQAFAIALNGWILSAFGYVPDVQQEVSAQFGIRLLCGPIPFLFFIAGVIVLFFYPINQTFYNNILTKISERRRML